jgi:NAD(P)-dependent dehydrogenase (short-subunit alcohol dehydrogenase family)
MSSRPVAVVTGASAGAGRATVVELARRGFDVALLARGEAGLAGAAHDVECAGGRALSIPTDVAEHDEVRRAAVAAEAELGPISVWVNDAMTTIFSPVGDIDPAQFRRAVEVTFLGQVWGTMVALEHMRPRDEGTIVNVGSALAFIGIPLQSAYCSAKFAVRGFSESVRAELIHEGSRVRLCMVHLPALNTPQFEWCATTFDREPQPVAPIYEPEVAARFIVDAALDGRRSKIVGSWNKLLVTAARLAPGLGNQYAAIAAWESQLTDQPLAPGRRANLQAPVDHTSDHGPEGHFGDHAGGFFEPSFLRTLPDAARKFAVAFARVASEKLRPGERKRLARSG